MTAPRSPSARELWQDMVVTNVRSRFGLAALAVMLAAMAWQFASGSVIRGLVFLAIIAFVYLRVPWAVAFAIYVRRRDRR